MFNFAEYDDDRLRFLCFGIQWKGFSWLSLLLWLWHLPLSATLFFDYITFNLNSYLFNFLQDHCGHFNSCWENCWHFSRMVCVAFFSFLSFSFPFFSLRNLNCVAFFIISPVLKIYGPKPCQGCPCTENWSWLYLSICGIQRLR